MSVKFMADKTVSSPVEIIDVTEDPEYERFLYRCILHSKNAWTRVSYRKHKLRREYLEFVIPRGFRKKVLFYKGDHVGMIEYVPAEVSDCPIIGDNVIVMNCIWVHKRGQGHNFGKRLIAHMMEDKKEAAGFATLGLENHWTAWMKKREMEWLGFKSVKSVKLMHKRKHKGRRFTIHLMWMPANENTKPPTWDESKLLEGTHFCEYHPLYHGRYGCEELKEIFEK